MASASRSSSLIVMRLPASASFSRSLRTAAKSAALRASSSTTRGSAFARAVRASRVRSARASLRSPSCRRAAPPGRPARRTAAGAARAATAGRAARACCRRARLARRPRALPRRGAHRLRVGDDDDAAVGKKRHRLHGLAHRRGVGESLRRRSARGLDRALSDRQHAIQHDLQRAVGQHALRALDDDELADRPALYRENRRTSGRNSQIGESTRRRAGARCRTR